MMPTNRLATNRLADEKSPYLLQHAHNPVDWYPWGEEAFLKAKNEDKPIFLSIGYSTCHWCHVMERESFENEEVAAVLNEHFVPIKVDREERPDVDAVYMTFVQATTGSGGWPLSAWLTPDLKPFVGGTYFPPDDYRGRRGFRSLLLDIAETWKVRREEIVEHGDAVVRSMQEMTASTGASDFTIDDEILEAGYRQIVESYDPHNGGFGGAPKFPRPVTLEFLFRYWKRADAEPARDAALHTLRAMAAGGMYDHIGGGFHRYSVDERWHVPHFEKMLYDQAQLVASYVDAYRITGNEAYAGIARDVLDYVLRDMTDEEGGFYSAEDADSAKPENPEEKGEGAFYVWELEELRNLLGERNAEIVAWYHGAEQGGNVRHDPFDEFGGKNVLFVARTPDEAAARFGMGTDEIRQILRESRRKLFEARLSRPRPHLDDKILTSWNGLMISAFARAAQVLDDERYLRAAERAARFVRQYLFLPDTHRLLRRYRDGEAAIDGYADDYAFMIAGLLDLYEATYDVTWLQWGLELQERQIELFLDEEQGGYFSTSGADTSVVLRMKEWYDGAEPSPNAVSALNLVRIDRITDNARYRGIADGIVRTFGDNVRRAPSAAPLLLSAIDALLATPRQVVIVGRTSEPETRDMLLAVRRRYLPNTTVLVTGEADNHAFLADRLGFLRDIDRLDGTPTAYVCESFVCKLPTNSVEKMEELLEGTTVGTVPNQQV